MDSSISALAGYQAVQPASQTTSNNTAANADQAVSSNASSGDTVSISSAAKELSKILGRNTGSASGADSEDSDPVTKLKKQIEELEKKIAEVQQSSLPDGPKQAVVQGLQTELASMNQQLAQLMAQAASSGGGAGAASGGSAKA